MEPVLASPDPMRCRPGVPRAESLTMTPDTLNDALASCEREPIHIPGAILSHGAMLVCDPVSMVIRFHSENFLQITAQKGVAFPASVLKGRSAADFIGERLLHDLRNAATRSGGQTQAGVLTGVRLPSSDAVFDIAMHTHGGLTFVEIEPALDGGQSAAQALELTRQLVGRLAGAGTAQRLHATGARLVQALLGFDRVMIYRFQHDGSGKVVAEARLPHMESFNGHHFPPGDIPPQARALYLANPIRSIPDSTYSPVPLVPGLAAGESPVDMSHCQLRSVSPVHCEYLRNMGVGASLSISIIVDGKLWGLIACHGAEPRVVPLALRVSAELLGHFLSLQIATVERREDRLARAETRAQLERLMVDMGHDQPLIAAVTPRLGGLAATLGCHGAAVLQGTGWAATPGCPDELTCRKLVDHARSSGGGAIWHSQEIAQILPDAGTEMAGALVIQLSERGDTALILFRRDEAHDIDWAGAPTKMVTAVQGRHFIAPRQSFALWRERVQGRSVPWSEHDLANADTLLSWLRDVMLQRSEVAAEEHDASARRNQLIREELNHRIKNVLSLVKSIAQQTGSSATSVADYAQTLEGRLHALASAHDRSLMTSGGSLAGLIEAEAVLHRTLASPDRVLARGPALQLDDKGYGVLALVLHEMMTNAVKYGALSRPEGRLTIDWTLDETGPLVIDWREEGGPEVVPPRRQGFGSRLIRSSLEHDLRGTAEIDFAPQGLFARLIVPRGHVHADATPTAAAVTAGAVAPGTLDSMTVLVVEDQALIAMDTEETLRQLGAGAVVLARNTQDALRHIELSAPHLAVLDVNLGDETSQLVAETLAQRGVPFLFMTGYSDHVMMPPAMRHVPVVRKPVSAAAIAANVALARAAVSAAE